jgi:hypothetical protein
MSEHLKDQVCVLCDLKKHTGVSIRAAGGWVCIACYRRELAPRLKCDSCGVRAPVSAWLGERGYGRAYCSTCYQRELHVAVCFGCKKKKSIHTRVRNRPLCVDCYGKVLRVQLHCSDCGERKRVYARNETGESLCRSCYLRRSVPTERCWVCRKLAHAVARSKKGPICSTCYASSRKDACVHCGRTMRIARRTTAGRPVCSRCAFHRFTTRRRCSACNHLKPTRRRTADGRPLCDACYGRRYRRRPSGKEAADPR